MSSSQFTAAAHVSLSDILSKAAANQERLKLWSETHASDITKGLVVGSIMWKKALGRPSGQKMGDGFIVNLVATTVAGDQSHGVETPIILDTQQMLVDKKWDDSDGDNYLVHFLHVMPSGNVLRVMVSIADGIDWRDDSGGQLTERLFISPSYRAYGDVNYFNPLSPQVIPNLIDPFWVISASQAKITAHV